jgi:hypothetical protein
MPTTHSVRPFFVLAWTLLAFAGKASAQDVIFQDGFESGDLSAWSSNATDDGDLSVSNVAALSGSFGLQAVVDDVNPLFVRDNTPGAEDGYQARFHFDPHGFDPGETSSHFRTRILIVHDAVNARLVAIVLRRINGVFSVRGRVRLDDGTRANTSFVEITDGPHVIELDWKRSSSDSASDGSFELLVDGFSVGRLTGLDNSAGAVDYVRMGALSVKTGASGTLYFDAFESERPTCLDTDGDGWTTCHGDCCDAPGLCPGADPARVNPGAFEVGGNGVEDDCDAATPDTGLAVCDASLASNSSVALDYARAVDLCSFTVEAPPLAQRKWGVISAGFLLADGTGTPAANSRSIRSSFGSNVPLAGGRVAVLSTGNAAAQGQTNPPWINPQQPGVDTGATSGPPADWLAANGGTVPSTPGCPDPQGGTTATDPTLLKLRVRVPTNAHSFSVRAFFYSSEYPEYVCSPFNDSFLTLLDSQFLPGSGESPNPADKNLAFYDPPPAGAPFLPVGGNLAYGNTGLFTQCKNGPIGCATTSGAVPGTISTCVDTTQLTGTGFDLANPGPKFAGDPGYCGSNNLLGGGTGWLRVSGNVEPGETIELRFVLWDAGDPWYDSVVLLDDFRWSVMRTTAGTTP